MMNRKNTPPSGVLLSGLIHPTDLILGMGGADLMAELTSRGLAGHWGAVASDPDHAAAQLMITVLSCAAFMLFSRNVRHDLDARGVPIPAWLGGPQRGQNDDRR